MIYLGIVFTKEKDLKSSWDDNKEQENCCPKRMIMIVKTIN